MKNILLKGLIATSLMVSAASADVFVGAKYGVMNFGGSAESDNYTYEGDTTDAPLTLRVGYTASNDNRHALYYKVDEVSIDGGSDVTANTIGYSGEIGLSSLKTKVASGNLLPFFGYGIGFGSGEMDNYSEDLTAVEVDISIGLNYKIESLEVTADLYRRAIAFSDDYDTLTYALNGIELGVNYRF